MAPLPESQHNSLLPHPPQSTSSLPLTSSEPISPSVPSTLNLVPSSPILAAVSVPWNAWKDGGVTSPGDETFAKRKMMGMQKTEEKKWNTKNIGWRLGGDLLAAGSAGVIIAPIITMIDRAIIENASSRCTLSQSLRTSLSTLLTRPHIYLSSRPFLLVFALYTGTYLSANTLDTLFSTSLHPSPASTTTSGTGKFLATSSANLSLCLYKDSQFTRMFGVESAVKRKVPGITYALFAARDCLTIFASFNLPPMIAPLLPLSKGVEEHVSRVSVAQFLAPAGVQVFSTPLHLLGLDVYNRRDGGGETVSWGSRGAKVIKDWGKSCAARVSRIVPAFGIGGVVNSGVRERVMRGLE